MQKPNTPKEGAAASPLRSPAHHQQHKTQERRSRSPQHKKEPNAPALSPSHVTASAAGSSVGSSGSSRAAQSVWRPKRVLTPLQNVLDVDSPPRNVALRLSFNVTEEDQTCEATYTLLTAADKETTSTSTARKAKAGLYEPVPLIEDTELIILLDTLPDTLRQPIWDFLSGETERQLVEILVDVGRPPTLWFLNDTSVRAQQDVTPEHLGQCLEALLDGGKMSFTSDNRIGISKTLHRISAMRNRVDAVVGLTYRIGRHIPGVCNLIQDLIFQCARKSNSRTPKSLLLLGPPGAGKTTLLRDVARCLSDEMGKRVLVIDTSNEIAGDGDVPHSCIGFARRLQVKNRGMQHNIMIEAVQNHNPQVIVVDEIGTAPEVNSARTIAQRGVSVVATAHGIDLGSLLKNPTLVSLVGGVHPVILGDKAASQRKGPRMQKTVLERKGAPTFDMLVELVGRNDWRVYKDVAATVDTMLANQPRVLLSFSPSSSFFLLSCSRSPPLSHCDFSVSFHL
ncbi:PFAM ATPase associated with various cellular activities (AAA), variant 2 [Balamuthia mandrillaris]